MTLAVFADYLKFAEAAQTALPGIPPTIDLDELDSAIVSFGVVLLHAQMEQCIRAGLEAKLTRCTDPEVLAYARSAVKEKTGRLKIDALKDTLGRFGAACKQSFTAAIAGDACETSWNSICNLRNDVAHEGKRAQLTIADMRVYFEDIRRLLGYYCKSLGLTAIESTTISSLIVVPP